MNHSWVRPTYELESLNFHSGDSEAGEQWFQQVVKTQYDYYPAYRTRLYYLLPRWGGSLDEMMKFGLQCYDEGRFDTQVPFALIDVIRMARQ